jgi:hypothetical protein
MKQLMSMARFDTEIFRVTFGTSWDRPAELYIGQYYGIAYKNENTKEACKRTVSFNFQFSQ